MENQSSEMNDANQIRAAVHVTRNLVRLALNFSFSFFVSYTCVNDFFFFLFLHQIKSWVGPAVFIVKFLCQLYEYQPSSLARSADPTAIETDELRLLIVRHVSVLTSNQSNCIQ
jgi:hypothetical protein